MRSRQPGAAIVRRVTQAHFDHVALVVRTSKDGLYDFSVVESVGQLGVSSQSWSDLRSEIGEGKFYEKVALRRLIGPRNQGFHHQLDAFLSDVWGKKYSLSLSKIGKGLLMSPTSSFTTPTKRREIRYDENQTSFVSPKRNFFCSELVAKCYKVMGILETNRGSESFYPGDFAR